MIVFQILLTIVFLVVTGFIIYFFWKYRISMLQLKERKHEINLDFKKESKKLSKAFLVKGVLLISVFIIVFVICAIINGVIRG